MVTMATGKMCACLPMRLPNSSVTMNPSSGSSGMSATAIFMYSVPST